jgi:bacteriorhodopsin
MGNNAPTINPNIVNGMPVQITITARGSDFYYAICAVMGATTLAILSVSYKKPKSHRIFFYMTAAINMVATIAYFAMGSNLGLDPH